MKKLSLKVNKIGSRFIVMYKDSISIWGIEDIQWYPYDNLSFGTYEDAVEHALTVKKLAE